MRPRVITFLLVVALAVLVVVPAAVVGPAASDEKEIERAKVPKPLVIAEADRNRKAPFPATAASVQAGRQIYESQCAMCHGLSGNGKGDLAVRLKFEMPDFTKRDTQKARTDGEFFYILSVGHGEMQGEGQRLSDTTRWNIVQYIRTMGPPPEY